MENILEGGNVLVHIFPDRLIRHLKIHWVLETGASELSYVASSDIPRSRISSRIRKAEREWEHPQTERFLEGLRFMHTIS